jgi:hypothetical protein
MFWDMWSNRSEPVRAKNSAIRARGTSLWR